jgi:carbamoyl-phosphate synthase / aspartate carbamoyltransferase
VCAASDDALAIPTDQRLFAVANALHEGYTVERIWALTKIDRWFLTKLKNIVRLDRFLGRHTMADLSPELLRRAKQLGFADAQIARCVGSTPTAIRKLRTDLRITPFVKQIDTGTSPARRPSSASARPSGSRSGPDIVAAEFPCFTNYLYMTYHGVEHDITFDDHGIMVLGSGVYRIGRFGPAPASPPRRPSDAADVDAGLGARARQLGRV